MEILLFLGVPIPILKQTTVNSNVLNEARMMLTALMSKKYAEGGALPVYILSQN